MKQISIIYYRFLLVSILSFIGMVVSVEAHTVTTKAASNITTTTAKLNGSYTNDKLLSAYCFQYGTSTSYGSTTSIVKRGATSSNETFTVSETITGLKPGTTYHFRLVATTTTTVYGKDMTFTTKEEPKEPSTPSSPSPSSGATNVATSGTFSWSCNSNDGSTPGYELYLGKSTSSMSLYKQGTGKSCSYSGLSQGQKYYWKVIAYNSSNKSATSSTWNFTTKDAASPSTPSSPSPSDGATNVATSGTFSWSCNSNDNSTPGYELYLGTSSSNMKLYKQGSGKSCSYSGLSEGQKYYWKVIAYNSSNKSATSSTWSFTTKTTAVAPSAPTSPSPSDGATDVATSGTFSWSCTTNDGSSTPGYDLYLGKSSSSMSLYKQGLGKSCAYKDLDEDQTYYWKVIVYNSSNLSKQGSVWSFTTESSNSCKLPDVDKSSAYYDATCYLYSRGIISGSDVDGKMKVEDKVKRAHMAKIAFRGVYSLKERSVPSSVPSDNYPTVYSDLTDKSTYYYQAARALLYLEYGDGVAPFDRNRLEFAPEENISRLHVLKVLMETFNIQSDVTGTTNPFPDDSDVNSLMSSNPVKMGYIRKAAALGIITKPNNGQNTKFRPNDDCLRGEAFIMLARIMQKIEAGEIDDPNPSSADYFEPLNTTLATLALGVGLEMGNFSHYAKTSFDIDGVVPLVFAHTYNSYNTTLPEVFYGARSVNGVEETYRPLGAGWTHNYHSFVTMVGTGKNARAIVHWGGGNICIYKSDGTSFVSESIGVHDIFTMDGLTAVIKTKDLKEYRFTNQGGTGAMVLYLASVTDRNGNQLIINFKDGINGAKVISSVSDGHRQLDFSYLNGTNLLQSVTDPLNRIVKFNYTLNSKNGEYQLTSFTDAKGQQTKYTYGDASKLSSSRLLTRIQMPKGNYVENEYDTNRRLTQSVCGVNGQITTQSNFAVTAKYGSSTVTTSCVELLRGNEKSTYNYQYNSQNMLTSLTGEGVTNISKYENMEHPELPTSIQTNQLNIDNITYDNRGNVTAIRMKELNGSHTHTTRMSYDDSNNMTSITDAKGNTIYFTYDKRGNFTKVDAPENASVSLKVDSRGLVTSMTDQMGRVTEYEYNTAGNLVSSMLPALDIKTTIEYDAISRIIASFDPLNRKHAFTYDKNDNLTQETDAMNHTTKYAYDKNDNITSVTNAKGGVTTLTYDNVTDRMTSISFNGASKKFEYNKDGTLSAITRADGTRMEQSYNKLGMITDDGVNNYEYDESMRLSSVTDGNSRLAFGYDGFNRLIKVDYSGKGSNTVKYEYDDNSNVTAIVYPNGNQVTYSYDGLNRMKSVTTWNDQVIKYKWQADNLLSMVSYPNGMTVNYEYDEASRLISKKTTLANGTVVAGYSFKWDKASNIVEQEAEEPFAAKLEETTTQSYSYNKANRITKAGNISFSFDANGNTTKRGSESYSWDKLNRLIQADGTDISYDPMGLIRSYGDTNYAVSVLGNGYVLSDSKTGNSYIYGLGLEARISQSGIISYYVTDMRGSVVAIVDDSGNITHRYQYDDFGRVVQSKEQDFNPFRYVGKYGVMYNTDTHYYMRARHYDPTIGRFLSEDPVWNSNLYPYAGNNPIMNIDPLGLFDARPIRDRKFELDKKVAQLRYNIELYEGMNRSGKYTTTINGFYDELNAINKEIAVLEFQMSAKNAKFDDPGEGPAGTIEKMSYGNSIEIQQEYDNQMKSNSQKTYNKSFTQKKYSNTGYELWDIQQRPNGAYWGYSEALGKFITIPASWIKKGTDGAFVLTQRGIGGLANLVNHLKSKK